jgi:hypothetical protein
MKDGRSPAEISAALSRLAAEDAAACPPPAIQDHLLAEFRARPISSRKRVPFWALAIAAPIVLTVIVLYLGRATHSQIGDEPFYQMPYVIPAGPYERTEVRRLIVPVAALIASGLEVHVPDAGAVVKADVLFGQDGRALAIRLINGTGPVNARRTER